MSVVQLFLRECFWHRALHWVGAGQRQDRHTVDKLKRGSRHAEGALYNSSKAVDPDNVLRQR